MYHFRKLTRHLCIGKVSNRHFVAWLIEDYFHRKILILLLCCHFDFVGLTIFIKLYPVAKIVVI